MPVIQVDVRGERIGRRVPVSVPLVGTVEDTLEALLPLHTVTSDSRHLDRNPDMNDPADEPEFGAGGMMGNDFCLDENDGSPT